MGVVALNQSRAVNRVRWIVTPVIIALVSRIFSAILLVREMAQARALPQLISDPSPFVAWDGQWYLHIAQFGYHAAALQSAPLAGGHHDFAFYPAWPLLIRLFSLNGLLPMDGTAVVLANFLFVLAVLAVFRLFADRFGDQAALWGTILLAFNPVAYVFSMAYTEALFVLVAALYFVDRYGPRSPIFAGLTALVRVSGLAIGASAAVMFVLGKAPRLRLLLIGGAVGLAFAAWWVFIWRLTGSFTGWYEGSASWSRTEGVASIMREIGAHANWEALWLLFVGLMIVGSLLMLRRHTDMAVYGLVAISLSLIGAPASSMPRHAMVAFPAFGALADKLGPRLSALLAVLFAVGETIFVQYSFGADHRPP